MNRSIKIVLIITFLAGLTVYAAVKYSDGPPDGYTGAPDEETCVFCHEFGPDDGKMQIITPYHYKIGDTAMVIVTLEDSLQLRWGFELTVIDSFENGAGAFEITDPVNTQLSDNTEPNRDYVKHTSVGTYMGTLNGPVTWNFNWVPPEDTIIGDIFFYAAGNAANNNFGTSGDNIYTASFKSSPLTDQYMYADNTSGYIPTDGDPTNSVWHELWPDSNTIWTLSTWFDSDDNSLLNVADYVDLIREVDGDTIYRKFHTEWVGPTFVITETSNPGDTIYLDYIGYDNPYVQDFDSSVLGTYWLEVTPNYGNIYLCSLWVDIDFNNTVNSNDIITFWEVENQLEAEYEILESRTDAIFKEMIPLDTLPYGIHLHNTDGYVVSNGDPTSTYWTEIHPLNDWSWEVTWWYDEGDGELSRGDSVILNDIDWSVYHVSWVGPTMIVTDSINNLDTLILEYSDSEAPGLDTINLVVATYWLGKPPAEHYLHHYVILEWLDDFDGYLGPGDFVVIQDLDQGTWDHYRVEEIATDMIAGPVYDDPQPTWEYNAINVSGWLTIWGAYDHDSISPPIFGEDYITAPSEHSDTLPRWANGYFWKFRWDASCGNINHGEVEIPKRRRDSWYLDSLAAWLDTTLTEGESITIPSVGDPTGSIQYVYIAVDLEAWYENPQPTKEQYIIIDGRCDDLPGYLIGTTPIEFDSLAVGETPFSTVPLTGTLSLDGTLTFTSNKPDFVCDCFPGDANNSGNLNILDVTYLINYLYKGGPAPMPYPLCNGDANCNCAVNILDATYLINYLYIMGQPPCTCEEWMAACGELRK